MTEKNNNINESCFVRIDLITGKIIEQSGTLPYREITGNIYDAGFNNVFIDFTLDDLNLSLKLHPYSAAFLHGAGFGAGSSREYYEDLAYHEIYKDINTYTLINTRGSALIKYDAEIRGNLKIAKLSFDPDNNNSFYLHLSSDKSGFDAGMITLNDGKWELDGTLIPDCHDLSDVETIKVEGFDTDTFYDMIAPAPLINIPVGLQREITGWLPEETTYVDVAPGLAIPVTTGGDTFEGNTFIGFNVFNYIVPFRYDPSGNNYEPDQLFFGDVSVSLSPKDLPVFLFPVRDWKIDKDQVETSIYITTELEKDKYTIKNIEKLQRIVINIHRPSGKCTVKYFTIGGNESWTTTVQTERFEDYNNRQKRKKG